ncbi:hypothetical protein [Salsuginibacillus kocurii]|uniref:UPF0738 family protein n=1 Tax=Salsuginibacillus kocurii TaxID=427078 RepID=UPI00035E80C2|nr:hypothetical protein [Salsuginibacillus kocurii]
MTVMHVEHAEINEQAVRLYLKDKSKQELKEITPTERLLTDSNDFAFVYIVDQGGMFTQVRFAEHTWPVLNEARKERLPVVLAEAPEIELTSFHSELDFLLENIPGNNNYGEDFEHVVAQAFPESQAN